MELASLGGGWWVWSLAVVGTTWPSIPGSIELRKWTFIIIKIWDVRLYLFRDDLSLVAIYPVSLVL